MSLLEEALAYLLDLRLRCRGTPEAMPLVDRCLAPAETADVAELQQLEAEIEAIRLELAARFANVLLMLAGFVLAGQQLAGYFLDGAVS